MGLRFRKRIKLAPGLNLNIGLGGVSLTAGVRGANVNLGKKGIRGTVGLPGSGLSYSEQLVKFGGKPRGVPQLRPPRSSGPTADDVKGFRVALSQDLKIELELDYGAGYQGDMATRAMFVQLSQRFGAEITDWLTAQAQERNDDLALLINIHEQTASPGARFNRITPFPEAPPVLSTVPALGIIDRLNPFAIKRQKEELEQVELAHRQALADYDNRRQRHEQYTRQLLAVQRKAQVGDLDAMEQILTDCLSQITWPRETLIDFEFSNDSHLLLQVDLPELEDVPEHHYSVKPDLSGLAKAKVSQGERLKTYQQHIYGIALRLVGEAFASLPTVGRVTLSGYTQRRNSQGQVGDEYVISCDMPLDQWRSLFQRMVNSPALLSEQQSVRVKPTTTGRLGKIEPHL